MKLSSITRSRGGRVALAAVPLGIAASVLLGGVAQGAVPVSMAVSGQKFQITADKLVGEGFSQYAGVAVTASKQQIPVAISNIDNASLTNLCQAVTVIPAMGLGLKITAGDAGADVTAQKLQIGMTDLSGDAKFENIRIGIDASTVLTATGTAGERNGTAGEFAQDASKVTIDNLNQHAYSTTAGVFNLTHLGLALATNPSCD